jgi:hypothetical protein
MRNWWIAADKTTTHEHHITMKKLLLSIAPILLAGIASAQAALPKYDHVVVVIE